MKDKWIKFDSNDPKLGELVLVTDGKAVSIGCWDEGDHDTFEWYTDIPGDVTHWMPFPDPPKEGE